MTQVQLDRIARLEPRLHAFALVTADMALGQARAADAEIARGIHRGPLHGVPVAVKDLCAVAGTPTGAGMAPALRRIAAADATLVRRLKQAGAVLIGKTELSEGAYSDHHAAITPPRNPWNADYWTGISSSGSGVATAAGLCHGAIASDTGGSIRWPAAANGVTGLKPSWGRVSRHGVAELAPSLDHVGTMARSAKDAGALLGVIAGGDDRDPTALQDPVPDYLKSADEGVRRLRIGFDEDWNTRDVSDDTVAMLAHAIEVFAALGAELVPARLPDVTQAIADWTPNCAIEAAVAHEATYVRHKDQYGAILSGVIETGRALSATDYQKILLRRMEFRGRVNALFGTMDLLLTPVQPFAALPLADISSLGAQPELIVKLQRYTCPFDMTGHPTITLPGGFTALGLPLGFQLIAPHLEEASLVRAGAAFQSATSWHQQHPFA
ncbi:MAG: amidase [Pseudomonadota bacterium]